MRRLEEKHSSLAAAGIPETWEPSASCLPVMSPGAGFGVNGATQGRSANTEPLMSQQLPAKAADCPTGSGRKSPGPPRQNKDDAHKETSL